MKKFALGGVSILLLLVQVASSDQPRTIRISQNETAAGHVRNGVLSAQLEITEGVWHPEADNGPSIAVQAFAEAGKEPQIPGPLIRVQEGQSISLRLSNKTAMAARVFGLHERPGPSRWALEIPPGQSRAVRFQAGFPGIYYYWATTGNSSVDRTGADSQLSGAFIVEPKGETKHSRVFVIGHWQTEPLDLWVINGKMWPFTPTLTQPVGSTLRSCWINPTGHHHPMHLHGTYFTVLSTGGQETQTVFTRDQRPFVATQDMEPGSTMEIEWAPIHEGNWLFHCHIPFHTDWKLGLAPPPPDSVHGTHGNHMAGLVIGFRAIASQKESHSTAEARRLDLYVAERDKHYENVATFPEPLIGMGYQWSENGPPVNPPVSPGPLLVLKRGEPVEITIHNQLKQPTAVHWHAMELESYYDGVPDWSGSPGNTAPSIPPGQTFTAKFTPPRSGSFMYHTHMNDLLQVGLGLEGPLIVLDQNQRFDPETDKILFVTRDGVDNDKAPFLLNGSTTPPPMELRGGKTYRLRFFSLSIAGRSEVHLQKDGTAVTWQAIAKDGADLPMAQAVSGPAIVTLHTGETFDFEWTPQPGEYRMESYTPGGKPQFTVEIHVRE